VIVTIDGPAGAGKSSIARDLAQQLGFEFLDTGALYRTATLGALREGLDLSDAEALAGYVGRAQVEWSQNRVFLDGNDVTDQIRTAEVTRSIRHLADLPAVRKQLSGLQRRIARGRDIVTEGRDQGTEVFPDAHCKVFLTASPEERARRRQAQLAAEGQEVSRDEILAAQNQRDLEDRLRDVGRLRAAEDAIVLQTDGMSPEDVLARVVEIVQQSVRRCQLGNRS
jgi:cytidylate kinase/pantoate ligase/cytidylate kinase